MVRHLLMEKRRAVVIRYILVSLICIDLFSFFSFALSQPVELNWPQITRETKPWTRWWWMGNTVNKTHLNAALKAYKEVGLGGMEITPIYGVIGYEDQFIDFLSPEWMNLLIYTLEEAGQLDLGIDMATGTGWPFGGPWVDSDNACKYMVNKIYVLKSGERLEEPIRYVQQPLVRSVRNQIYQIYGNILREKDEKPEGSVDQPLLRQTARILDINQLVEPISANKNLQALALEQVRFQKELPLQVLMAFSDRGEILNLTDKVEKNGQLNWRAINGNWTLYAVFQGWHGKMVERAAPGGEGNVIDHFSKTALENYLKKFDQIFSGYDIEPLRAFFNDSYEVDDARGQADWTTDLFEEFILRRGYDLREQLPALFGKEDEDTHIRVLSDYRETISDLLLEKFTHPWREWAYPKKGIIRNQAHGSPANILDLYGASDIPETEGTDILRIKFASSAAHVTGKKLTSSESATWLDEHFMASLADVKENLDRYLLGGVNHIFYHGTTYSPQGEEWPGWMFYASVHFGPTNSFWSDFAALNHYVARCQSFLQEGKPDNDILLYFPFFDRLAVPGSEMLVHFNGGGPAGGESEFRKVAQFLWEQGYAFDFISDRQLKDVAWKKNGLVTEGSSYKTVLLPACRFIPLETFQKLTHLAEAGATIVVHKYLPEDVPGMSRLANHRSQFKSIIEKLNFFQKSNGNFRIAKLGKGNYLLGEDLDEMLKQIPVEREPMVDLGLKYIRRKTLNNTIYFIKNEGEKVVDGWIPLVKQKRSYAVFNPMKDKFGKAFTRESLKNQFEVYLQLQPKESSILKAFDSDLDFTPYPSLTTCGPSMVLEGSWKIRFIAGGPELPAPLQTNNLGSWTEWEGDIYKTFSGTAEYQISFDKPSASAAGWLLDLGKVCESAEVNLNGIALDTLISSPFQVYIPADLFKEKNILILKVSNLMLNRIADLDRRDVPWKKFYNVNFPARRRENRGEDGLFTAVNISPRASGLIGPVKLIPLNLIKM